MGSDRWRLCGVGRPGDYSTEARSSIVVVDYIVVINYICPMKDIVYAKPALRVLRRMPRNTARRIVSKIEAYAENPASQANNVTALQGRDGIRLRVGDWRVIMDDGVVLAVLDIGPRGGIYD